MILSLLGCVDRRETPGGETYVIKNDRGGQIISAEVDRAVFARWGGPIRIEGYCNSACAIFTTLPNVCLAENARIGFHSANINVGEIGNPQIAKYLRNGVLTKFIEEYQFVPHDDLRQLTATEYVRLDPETKLC
jgi:hypothetical protein